jgi:CheY-like chemotaxis protein
MSDQPQAPIHIFLAEDNPGDVFLVRQALEQHGVVFQMHVAGDGAEALHFLSRQEPFTATVPPDLIFLDLNLPKHDGPELLKYIRQNKKLASVPVVILTSSDSPQDRLLAMELGATCYIRKSSSLDEFMRLGATVKSLLARHAVDRNGCMKNFL